MGALQKSRATRRRVALMRFELEIYFLGQSGADFDTFLEAGFFVVTAEGTDRVDDLVHFTKAHFLPSFRSMASTLQGAPPGLASNMGFP